MKIQLLFTFFLQVFSFQSLFRKSRNFKLFNDNNINNHEKLPQILDFDYFYDLVSDKDKLKLDKLNSTIPMWPQSEEEIKEDSFEGYLRNHFNLIKNNDNKIDFEEFLSWRKQIGTLLTRDELQIIYNEVMEKEKMCDLMNFILVNNVIDEVDGADF
jgi:hypothetical protein